MKHSEALHTNILCKIQLLYVNHIDSYSVKLSHSMSFIHSFILLACAECDNSLPFSGASSIPLCYVPFPATLLHQLFFHPLAHNRAIYFLVYLSILLFPNSYIYITVLGILFPSILCIMPKPM